MGAALSIFVLLSISVFIVRVASVALRLSGLSDDISRFQALSAFTGTGFTTTEAESIVNYPVRRRIVSLLMIVGNLGLVTVLATLVVSLVNTEGEMDAVFAQLAWLIGGLIVLWVVILNRAADRVMCKVIGRILKKTTVLGKRRFQRLLQIADGYSVCEHPIVKELSRQIPGPGCENFDGLELKILGVRGAGGDFCFDLESRAPLGPGDWLMMVGSDDEHEKLECILSHCADGQTDSRRHSVGETIPE